MVTTPEAQFVELKCWTVFIRLKREIGSKSEKNADPKEESNK